MAHLEKEAHRNIFHRTLSHNITDIITEENSLKEDSQNKMISIPMKIIKLQKSKNAYELIPERIKLVPNAIEENKDSITNTPSRPLPIRQKKIPCYTPKTDIVEDETVTTRLDQLKEKKAIKNYIERLDLLNKEDIHQDKGIKTSPKRQHNYMSYSLDRRDTLYSLTQKLEGNNYYNSNILNEKNDRNNNDKPKTNTILNESLDTTKYCLQDKLTTMMKYKKKSKPNSVLVFDKRTLLNDINNRHHQEKKIEIISIMNNSQRKIEDNDNDSQFDLFSFVEEKEKEKKSSMKTRNINQTKYNAEDNSNNSEINIKYNGSNYKTNSINYLHSFEIIQEEKEEENPNNFHPQSQSISDIRNCSYDRKHIDSLQINGLTKRENTKPLFYSGLQIDNTTNKMTLSKKENINSKSNEVKYSLFGNDSSAKQRHQNRNSILKCALSNNFTIASDNNSFISRENSYSHLPSNNYYNISHDQSYNNTDQTHLFESKRINESYSASQYQYDIMNKRHNIQLIFERKKNKNKYIVNNSPIFSPSPSLSNMRGIESTPDYTNYRGFSYEGINGQNYGNDSIDQYPLFIDSYCNNLKLKNSSMKRNCIISPLHLSITNIPLTNTYQNQKSYQEEDQERFNDYNPIVYYQNNNTPENKIHLLNEMISHHQHNKNKMKKNNVTKIINVNRKYLCHRCESEFRPLLYHYHT